MTHRQIQAQGPGSSVREVTRVVENGLNYATGMADKARSTADGADRPTLVDPTSSPASSSFSLAPRRFRDLNGKTVGLLNSTKFNSDHLLDGIGELLGQRYELKGLVRDRKRSFGTPIPEDHAKEMAEQCDVVITAVGD